MQGSVTALKAAPNAYTLLHFTNREHANNTLTQFYRPDGAELMPQTERCVHPGFAAMRAVLSSTT